MTPLKLSPASQSSIQRRRFRVVATTVTTKTVVKESVENMISITHSVDQYTILPITFADANGPRVLPSGAVTANVVSGEGARARIVETPNAEGVLQFAVELVTGPTAGTYRFTVTDTDVNDTVVINTLEIEDISVASLNVDIVPGTPEFRPKSELPPA